MHVCSFFSAKEEREKSPQRNDCEAEWEEQAVTLLRSALHDPELSRCVVGVLIDALGDFSFAELNEDKALFWKISAFCFQSRSYEVVRRGPPPSLLPPFAFGSFPSPDDLPPGGPGDKPLPWAGGQFPASFSLPRPGAELSDCMRNAVALCQQTVASIIGATNGTRSDLYRYN